MAEKDRLKGSFGSLSDTLAMRFDPGDAEVVVSRWLGTMGFCATISRRTREWNALAQQSAAYDPIIADLDAATHAIVVAKTKAEKLAALNLADAALAKLNKLLDDA